MPQAELVAAPAAGRSFSTTLLPGIADAAGSGRVRVDAIARWIQDVAYGDVVDAGLNGDGTWVLRRMRLRIDAFPRFGEPLELRTFCSGLGRFSAERRTTLAGETAAVEAVALWIWLDDTGQPGRFPQRFVELYAPSAQGRGAPVRLHHPEPPAGAEREPWRFRAADIDVAGHVNNSHYWEPLEEAFASTEPEALDAEIEHREPAVAGDAEVVRAPGAIWIEGGGALHASIRLK